MPRLSFLLLLLLLLLLRRTNSLLMLLLRLRLQPCRRPLGTCRGLDAAVLRLLLPLGLLPLFLLLSLLVLCSGLLLSIGDGKPLGQEAQALLRVGGDIIITSSEAQPGEGLRGPAPADSCSAPGPLLLLLVLGASMQLSCCSLVLLLGGVSVLLLSFTTKGGEPRLEDGDATAIKPEPPGPGP